jgi:hypothetical protein
MIAQTEVAYSYYVNVVGEIRASRKRNFQIQVVAASLSDVCVHRFIKDMGTIMCIRLRKRLLFQFFAIRTIYSTGVLGIHGKRYCMYSCPFGLMTGVSRPIA